MKKATLLIAYLFSLSMSMNAFAQTNLYFKDWDIYSSSCSTNCKAIEYEEFGYLEYNSITPLSWPYENLFMLSMNTGAVNSCGAIYRYSKAKNKLFIVNNSNKKPQKICNLTQLNGTLISQSRESAEISHEIAFTIKDSLLTAMFNDKVFGDFITRTVGNKTVLVSNQKDPLSRSKLIAQISSKKAYFYNENFEKTESYLINGDEAEPLYLKFNDKGDWVKIKFNKVEAFIKKSNVRFFSEFYN